MSVIYKNVHLRVICRKYSSRRGLSKLVFEFSTEFILGWNNKHFQNSSTSCRLTLEMEEQIEFSQRLHLPFLIENLIQSSNSDDTYTVYR